MKQLSKTQSIIMLAGACLMVTGAALYVFGVQKVAPPFFVPGTLMFAAMQYEQKYTGTDLTIRRLRKIMLTGAVFFIISALLMTENAYQFLFQYFAKTIDGYNAYVKYVHNNWVVALLVAAVLQLYSTHRISSELEKTLKKS